VEIKKIVLFIVLIIIFLPGDNLSFAQTPSYPVLDKTDSTMAVFGDGVYYLKPVAEPQGLGQGAWDSEGNYVPPASGGIDFSDISFNLEKWKYGCSGEECSWDLLESIEEDRFRLDMSIAASSDNLFIFGGKEINAVSGTSIYNQLSNALYVYDPNSNNIVESDVTIPSNLLPRASAIMAAGEDSLYMAGGWTVDASENEVALEDFWRFDGSSWDSVGIIKYDDYYTDSYSFPEGALEAFHPAYKSSLQMFVLKDGTKDVVLLFGRDASNRNDFLLKQFNLSPPGVEDGIVDSSWPEYREEYSVNVDRVNNKLYLYGGVSVDGSTYYENELWEYDPETKNITNILEGKTFDEEPEPRTGALMQIYQNKIYLFGGKQTDYTNSTEADYSTQTWVYDLAKELWIDQSLDDDIVLEDFDFGTELYKGDVVVDNPRVNLAIRATGPKYDCGLDSDRADIYGNASMNFQFLWGGERENLNRGMSITKYPIITLTQDNTLTFQAEVAPGVDKRIIDAYWQVEGVRDDFLIPYTDNIFKGFDQNFFEQYIERLPALTKYVNTINSPGFQNQMKLEVEYNDVGINEAEVFEPGSWSTSAYGNGDKRLLKFHETFPPGKYRVYLTAIAFNDQDFQNTYYFNAFNNVYGSACGKTRKINPYEYGFYGPGGNLTYHYISEVFEFEVPEITNYEDILSVYLPIGEEDRFANFSYNFEKQENRPFFSYENFMKSDFMKMFWSKPPNIVNAMRPIFYGHKATPGSIVIPTMGRVVTADNKVKTYFPLLNDNSLTLPTNDITDNFAAIIANILDPTSNYRYINQADQNGKFSFQPLNLLPYNSAETIPFYFFHFLTVNPQTFDLIGAPPVKIAITNDRILPRIYNYKHGEKTVSPRPIILGSYYPNQEFLVQVNNQDPFQVIADFDGNFKFTIPENLNPNQVNILKLSSANDQTLTRDFEIFYSETADNVYPQIVSHRTGTPEFTNYPVFQINYKPNTELEIILDNEEISDEDSKTDQNGLYVLNLSKSLAGDVLPSSVHHLKVADKANLERSDEIDLRIYEKGEFLGNSTFTLTRTNDLMTLLDGGKVLINNDFRMFIHQNDKIRINDDDTNINIPTGTKIYFDTIGQVYQVSQGGIFNLNKGDLIILPSLGGQVWIENTNLKEIEIPANIVLISATDEASFQYLDKGEIFTLDEFTYQNSDNNINITQNRNNLQDYYLLPNISPVRITNRIQGEILQSTRPLFEGVSTSYSIVEVWGNKKGEKEKLMGSAVTDYFGRFELRLLQDLPLGDTYEFSFLNRGEQGPSSKMSFKVSENAVDEDSLGVTYEHQAGAYGDRDEFKKDYILNKKFPVKWEEAIW